MQNKRPRHSRLPQPLLEKHISQNRRNPQDNVLIVVTTET